MQTIDLKTLLLVLIVAASSGILGGVIAEWTLTPMIKKAFVEGRSPIHSPIRESASVLTPSNANPMRPASINNRSIAPMDNQE